MLLVDKWVQVSESSRRVLSDAAAKTLCEAIFSLAKAFYKLSIHHKQFHHLNAPQRRNKVNSSLRLFASSLEIPLIHLGTPRQVR